MVKKTDDVTEIVNALLHGGPFKQPTGYEIECNEILAKILKLRASPDIRERLKAELMEPQLRTAVIRMEHGRHDPSVVPQADMLHALAHPVHATFNYAGRPTIDGPIKGIRAFCMECQGDDVIGVRSCASVNCPLHAFRMGYNPFFSRLVDADAEAEESEAELTALETEHNLTEEARYANTTKI